MTRLRSFAAAVIASGLATLAAGTASAQTKWNLPAAYPADNFHTENLTQFSKDVEAPPAASSSSPFIPALRCSRRLRSSAR